MKYRGGVVRVVLCSVLLLTPLSFSRLAGADLPYSPLRFSELNVTGDEFIVLQNTSGAALDLSSYWLGYIGSDTSTATPSQQLSNQTLQPNDALLMNNGAAAACGAAKLDALNFSLSNTAGTLALWRLDASVQPATFSFLSSVSWGKSATTPTYLHIADETNVAKYNPTNAQPTWYQAPPENDTAQNWQVGDLQDCMFTPVVGTQTQPPTSVVWQIDGESPPFTVAATATVSSDSASGPNIPASDIGLKPPIISELFPNPASPQTDAEDEFIELYNPNNVSFDLSGFKLVIGSTTSSTTHAYTFPMGTIVEAKSFKAFMSGDTGLSLSNSGGQAWLLDPFGTVISQSEPYGKAGDGQAWLLAAGKWQWTTHPTPGAADVLASPISVTSSSSTKTSTKLSVGNVQAASTTNPSGSNGVSNAASAAAVTPIHPAALAAVAAAAVAYGVYEYRHDLANKLHQFREYRNARRASRQ